MTEMGNAFIALSLGTKQGTPSSSTAREESLDLTTFTKSLYIFSVLSPSFSRADR